jgi:hypothetical protein
MMLMKPAQRFPLVEWAQAQRLTLETLRKSPPFDDVFVRIIEKEIAND